MTRERELELVAEILALSQARRRPLGEAETLVPVEEYLDPARHARELERVFRPAFNLVGLSSELPSPGDFMTAEVVGAPALIARGEDGQLRAFLNVCRHRGAAVELRPRGRCKRFVCPYHAWTYDTDGALRRVRHAEGFPTLNLEAHGLVALPCVEVAGLVFVCPTPSHAPAPLPAALVTELERAVGPNPTVAARSVKTWAANWKLIVEGGLESYHFKVAHKDTIAAHFTDTLSTWERLGAHMRSVLPKRSIRALADQPQQGWDLRAHSHILYTLHPNAMLLLQAAHFDLILLRPLAVDQTQIEVFTVGAAPEPGGFSDKAQAFMQKNHAFSMQTLDEDFRIAEQIQRGLATGANTHLRFARFEDALRDWRRHLAAELSG